MNDLTQLSKQIDQAAAVGATAAVADLIIDRSPKKAFEVGLAAGAIDLALGVIFGPSEEERSE